ncbi:unnamed protein product [Rotaria sordida]|uniref:G-protein coupled receptors family 3 profile domain-containing protein n=1 Tax=Rotaria sordida TaxID=392033 RepID=A0A814R8Y0_9BILA|nr:unnamed protein product [Rotaria sordida]CAF1356224.1 unnamed protein product [Rotaria sordida]
MNISMSSVNSVQYPLNFNDNNIENHSLSSPLLPLNDVWILPIFILCLFGILCTIIISFLFIYLSYRRLNGHFLLTHLFICFSVCFIYIIIIIFLIRANELFCGLREFLTQFVYVLLFSSLLCRYIMQWLGSRILSKRTKQLTSLLIYLLLIFIQIPIGILWWYFTIPRSCQHRQMNILISSAEIPEFIFDFQKSIISSSSSSIKSCSNRCIVDYRFYATFTYTILELFFCTIIATCLFFYRCCHRRNNIEKDKNDKIISINDNNSILTFLNMFAFFFIDLIWLLWSFIYYFTHPFFIFPSLIISMFIIATICLIFILLPQIYYYSKVKINDIDTYKSKITNQSTTLYSNKLASTNDIHDQELLLNENILNEKKIHEKNLQQTLSNGSELSYELGSSGTFLPITRTPKGPFKVKTKDKIESNEKLDKLIDKEHQYTQTISNKQNELDTNETKVNETISNTIIQKEQRLQPPLAPLQRHPTSSSIASDFVTHVVPTGPLIHRSDLYRNASFDVRPSSSSMYYSSYPPPRRDETIIPILCNTERPRTSTPVQMRILVNSPSSSVPLTRRMHSGSDLRYVQHPYQHIYPPPTTPPYYSPQPQQYLFVDPYRTTRTRTGDNLWHSTLLQPGSTLQRYPYPYRRYHMDHRSLSQRLWDIDSGDDENEIEEDIIKIAGRVTPTKERLFDFRSNDFDNEHNILLHINDDNEENLYGKQYADV